MDTDPPSDNKRSQRQKIDKHGRGAALERLKQLKEKGVKHKYEVKNLENVYDTVDQKEYEKKVWQRQDDDWIVDDDGSGYVEDGREIFDDDLDAESIEAAKKEKGKKKKISRNMQDTTPVTGKGSIQSMFSSMPNKKSKKEHNIDEDDLLNDLLGEIKKIIPVKKSSTVTKFQELTSSPKIVIRDDSPPRMTKAKQNGTSISINRPSSESQDSAAIIIDNDETMDFDEIITKESSQQIEEKHQNTQEDITILESAFDDDDMQMDTDLINTVAVIDTVKTIKNDKENITDNVETRHQIDIKTKDIFSDDQFFTEWEANQMKQQQQQQQTSATNNKNQSLNTIDNSSHMDSDCMVENCDGEKILRFFWWDAHEIQSKPGNIFLFGKVFLKSSNNWVSCCVHVENIERKVYVLPRKYRYDIRSKSYTDQEVTMIDVYNEFNKKFAKGHQFRSKPSKKLYCFDVEDVPPEAEYLEVRYPADSGRISKDNMAGETIQHIFGTDTNFLELFLLDRKIKGPCWLDIVDADKIENKQISWCKMEFRCTMRNISITTMATAELPSPPLVLAALTIRTTLNPTTNHNEIVMISCLTHSKYDIHKSAPEPTYENHFCVLSRPTGVSWSFEHHELFKTYKATKVQKCDSERALLNYFLTQFIKIDADLIIGHDLIGYQLNVLFHRLSVLKIGNWSLFGKLRLKTMPQRVKNIQQDLFAGRLVCDLKITAKELIKSRSYDLSTLCTNILKINDDLCYELEQDEIRSFYEASNGLRKLIAWTMRDTSRILKMVYELNALPLAVQITNISGFILSKTLLGGRAERNEYLLLHAFTENNYIVPDKYKQMMAIGDDLDHQMDGAGKKRSQYAGGLVLEPKIGFYNTYILLMDFNSLYPSIIQEYNICFTEPINTKDIGSGSDFLGMGEGVIEMDVYRYNFGVESTTEMRILPKEIKKLVDSRRQVKSLMKKCDINSDQYIKYNIKQLALKLTANSMYGCLGYSKSRFYAQRLASKITELGREILQNTQQIVKTLCYEVIYGDTDSLMINTNIRDYEQVLKIGIKIKREVNQYYKQIELDIDGVFQYLLLLKKKKYAARIVSKDKRGNFVYQQEIKGLDIVRRDWCQLAAKTGKFILNNLLCDHDEDTRMKAIFNHLSILRVKLEQNEIPICDLTITKQLTKDPGAYADIKALPHVQVAVRYNLTHAKRLRQGDMISYVICADGTDRQAMQRGYHVDELKTNSKLKIDVKYYLLQQVFPLVNRLCEPIHYIQSEQIANCLGLEGLTFKQLLKPHDKTLIENSDSCLTSKKNKFIGSKSFLFKCVECGTKNVLNDPMLTRTFDDDKPNTSGHSNNVFKTYALDVCQNTKCHRKPITYLKSIQNQLTLDIHKYILMYYRSKFVCDDPSCTYTTKVPPIKLARHRYPICVCNNGLMYKEYDAMNLYKQLNYFIHIFDVQQIEQRPFITSQLQDAYNVLKETVTTYMNASEYFYVNLHSVFKMFDEIVNIRTQLPTFKEGGIQDDDDDDAY